MIEYRDRNIRRALIQKLCKDFDEKFTEDDTRKEWNVFLTPYRCKRQAERVTRSSGEGIDDVFDSNWEHFHQIILLDSTPETNLSFSTLDKCEITSPGPIKPIASQESNARAALYTALAKSFDKLTVPQPNRCESKKGENSLAERANLFRNTVANNLLKCDTKDWTLIKKKIFDLFFDYEQRNLTPRGTLTTPFNNFGNFTFPNIAVFQNYGYTGQTHVQRQNNQSSSEFQDYGYNKQMQPLQPLPSFIKRCFNFSLTSLACLEEFLLVDGSKSRHVLLGASFLQSPGITLPQPSSKSIRLGGM